MAKPFRHVAFVALCTAAIGAGPAVAQSVAARGGVGARVPAGAPSGAMTQTTKSFTQAPVGRIFGVPVVISAPVDAPYDSAASYSTFEGQPGGGPNALLAASIGSAP